MWGQGTFKHFTAGILLALAVCSVAAAGTAGSTYVLPCKLKQFSCTCFNSHQQNVKLHLRLQEATPRRSTSMKARWILSLHPPGLGCQSFGSTNHTHRQRALVPRSCERS